MVFLQYLYEGRRDIRIVPLLVGSFQDCVRGGHDPRARYDIARMVGALQALEREAGEPHGRPRVKLTTLEELLDAARERVR